MSDQLILPPWAVDHYKRMAAELGIPKLYDFQEEYLRDFDAAYCMREIPNEGIKWIDDAEFGEEDIRDAFSPTQWYLREREDYSARRREVFGIDVVGCVND